MSDDLKFDTAIHCIGDPDNGIVIITFNPLKVMTIGKKSIEAYNEEFPKPLRPTVHQTYRDLCKALVALIIDLGNTDTMTQIDRYVPLLDDIFKSGVNVTNADFCFSGNIDTAVHLMSMGSTSSRRGGYSMIHELIAAIDSDNTPLEYEIVPTRDNDYDGDGHDHDGGDHGDGNHSGGGHRH